MKKYIFTLILILSSSLAQAEWSYDLSGASGTRYGESYSEVHLGLNYYPNKYLNWRNSVFSQFGSQIDAVYGLDSAALFNYSQYNQNRSLGIELYAGPGMRLATEKANAGFGKAGITFSVGGLRIGGGVQGFHYLEERVDNQGRVLPQNETQYFVILSGGGKF